MIDLIVSRCSTHRLLLHFTLLHIANGSVSTLLVGHVLYLANLMSAICSPYYYLMVHIVDTSLYSLCFTNCTIPFLPLLSIHPQVFTWVLQPELLLKVITMGESSRSTVIWRILIVQLGSLVVVVDKSWQRVDIVFCKGITRWQSPFKLMDSPGS